MNPVDPTRYAVGIDLGTTHCALSYIDLAESDGEAVVQSTMEVPQNTAPGTVEARPLLPSFAYLPHESELHADALALPWGAAQGTAVGEVARYLGTKSALRLISSAKSWLCHAGVDRRAPILPALAGSDIAKRSPLDASVLYLEHLHLAWNHHHPGAPLAEQRVTITVPASFDPVARELTAEAARLAGLQHATLLEEPQAALYSWLGDSRGGWRDQVQVGDVILVIDVGGGTTDLSLIAVRQSEGNLQLERVAVGEHILLGGDNMDLALAYFMKAELEAGGTPLDAGQLATLTQGARAAKERLLSRDDADSVPVVIPGRGSKLIGGALRTELTRSQLTQIVMEGFFPDVPVDSRPASRTRAGLTQVGLPYAQDAAITRHLAAFLTRQADAVEALSGSSAAAFARPTAVLFNGGVFKSRLLSERVLQTLNRWLQGVDAPPVRELSGADLDLAVARGAAYYGYVRGGGGVRIRGGSAMAYYVGVESAMPAIPGMPPPLKALCVAPFGLEEGTRAQMPELEFGLVVGEPVRFHFFGSSVRRDDSAGVLLDPIPGDALQSLQDIEVSLPAEGVDPGDVVKVRLQAGITEVGTLEVEAVAIESKTRWKVELDTRDAGP